MYASYISCTHSLFEGKKVLSSDENDSDSDESLNNDYPKGWAPKNRSNRSSPHESEYEELQEEEYLHMQEAAENRVRAANILCFTDLKISLTDCSLLPNLAVIMSWTRNVKRGANDIWSLGFSARIDNKQPER